MKKINETTGIRTQCSGWQEHEVLNYKQFTITPLYLVRTWDLCVILISDPVRTPDVGVRRFWPKFVWTPHNQNLAFSSKKFKKCPDWDLA